MAVSILARSDAAQDGLQSFDPVRHLRGVADLVGRVFADELDARGRSAVREMQTVGRLSPVFGGLMQFAMLEDMLAGFVWVEQGRVVGNTTLQPVDRSGLRWRISNVAVAPEYRGRGIAHALMQSSVQEIAQRGGAWAVLQVRADNPTARRLYERLEFTDVCSDGLWRLANLPSRPPPVSGRDALQPLRPAAWRVRYELALAAQTPLSSWAQPVRPEQYRTGLLADLGERIGQVTGFRQVQRWGAWRGGRLIGDVETRAGAATPHLLRFAVHPDARGDLEATLVARGLHDLARAHSGSITVEHDAEHAAGVAALEAAGFRPQRILVTMRRRIKPGDREP